MPPPIHTTELRAPGHPAIILSYTPKWYISHLLVVTIDTGDINTMEATSRRFTSGEELTKALNRLSTYLHSKGFRVPVSTQCGFGKTRKCVSLPEYCDKVGLCTPYPKIKGM